MTKMPRKMAVDHLFVSRSSFRTALGSRFITKVYGSRTGKMMNLCVNQSVSRVDGFDAVFSPMAHCALLSGSRLDVVIFRYALR